MKITVMCTDPAHPVRSFLVDWKTTVELQGHTIDLVRNRSELAGGDILFLVSCTEIVTEVDRSKYRAALVLHASDLPRGRGWSPHVWAILGGASVLTVCLLEAADSVDCGAVWLRRKITLDGSELGPEINELLFTAELALMSEAVERFGNIEPEPQLGDPGPYLRRRTPEDSRVDPSKTLAEQFELLRVADAERYPTFMDFRGHRYVIRLEKVKRDAEE